MSKQVNIVSVESDKFQPKTKQLLDYIDKELANLSEGEKGVIYEELGLELEFRGVNILADMEAKGQRWDD